VARKRPSRRIQEDAGAFAVRKSRKPGWNMNGTASDE